MHNRLLVRNAHAILSGAKDTARLQGPDIRIVDGRIDAIGALSAVDGEAILDATDCVIYPAWVNTHHHLFQSLLKGEPRGINSSLTAWLEATPYRFRAAFDAELFRLAVRIGLVELVRSGCGTVADHNYLHYPGMPFDPSAILFEEARALGVRQIWDDGKFTYIQGKFEEPPVVYELKDKKGSLINFDFANGLYTIPKLLQNGYVAIGKAKVEFHREEAN